jgi:hypothetical protein
MPSEWHIRKKSAEYSRLYIALRSGENQATKFIKT